MQLFQIPPPPADLVCQPEQEALLERGSLLKHAALVARVESADDNEHATAAGSAIQKHLKEVESVRKELTAPYLAAQRAIKKVSDDYIAPLQIALARLGQLATPYRQAQDQKVELERRQRAAAIALAQDQERKAAEAARLAAENGDLMASVTADLTHSALAVATNAAVATPEPEATKTAGQSFKARDLGWECTDPIALWNAAPHLCNPPTPKPSAIKAVCAPESPVPGLRLWWKSTISFKIR